MTRHSDGGPTVTRRLVRDDIFPSNVDNMDSGNIRDDPNNHQVDRSSLISLSFSRLPVLYQKCISQRATKLEDNWITVVIFYRPGQVRWS